PRALAGRAHETSLASLAPSREEARCKPVVVDTAPHAQMPRLTRSGGEAGAGEGDGAGGDAVGVGAGCLRVGGAAGTWRAPARLADETAGAATGGVATSTGGAFGAGVATVTGVATVAVSTGGAGAAITDATILTSAGARARRTRTTAPTTAIAARSAIVMRRPARCGAMRGVGSRSQKAWVGAPALESDLVSSVGETDASRTGRAVMCADSQIRRNSAASSFESWKRASGLRAQARANQASNPSGSDAICDGTGSGRAQILSTSPPTPSLVKGRCPTRHSNAMTPSDQRSERPSTCMPSTCSGLM